MIEISSESFIIGKEKTKRRRRSGIVEGSFVCGRAQPGKAALINDLQSRGCGEGLSAHGEGVAAARCKAEAAFRSSAAVNSGAAD